MNNQDEITVRGRVYIAVDGYMCEHCSLRDLSACSAAPCAVYERADMREVIFVEKQ